MGAGSCSTVTAPRSHPSVLNVAPIDTDSPPHLPPSPFPLPSTAAQALSPNLPLQRPGDPPRSLSRSPAPGRPRSPTGDTGCCHQRHQPQGPAGPAAPPHVRHEPPPGRAADRHTQRPAGRLTDSHRNQSASGVQGGWAGLIRADELTRRPCHGAEQSAAAVGAESLFEWRSHLANQIARGLCTIFLPAP